MAFGAFASFQSAFLNFTLKKDKSITEAPPAEIVNLKIPIKPPNPPKTNNNEPMKETNKQKPDATPKDKNSKQNANPNPRNTKKVIRISFYRVVGSSKKCPLGSSAPILTKFLLTLFLTWYRSLGTTCSTINNLYLQYL